MSIPADRHIPSHENATRAAAFQKLRLMAAF